MARGMLVLNVSQVSVETHMLQHWQHEGRWREMSDGWFWLLGIDTCIDNMARSRPNMAALTYFCLSYWKPPCAKVVAHRDRNARTDLIINKKKNICDFVCNLRPQHFFEVVMFFDVRCLLLPSISILSKWHSTMLIWLATLQLRWEKKRRVMTQGHIYKMCAHCKFNQILTR